MSLSSSTGAPLVGSINEPWNGSTIITPTPTVDEILLNEERKQTTAANAPHTALLGQDVENYLTFKQCEESGVTSDTPFSNLPHKDYNEEENKPAASAILTELKGALSALALPSVFVKLVQDCSYALDVSLYDAVVRLTLLVALLKSISSQSQRTEFEGTVSGFNLQERFDLLTQQWNNFKSGAAKVYSSEQKKDSESASPSDFQGGKKRGRPPKASASSDSDTGMAAAPPPALKKRGRPPKKQQISIVEPPPISESILKRPVGRPRKTSQPSSSTELTAATATPQQLTPGRDEEGSSTSDEEETSERTVTSHADDDNYEEDDEY